MKMKICRIKSGLPTSPSFCVNMYKIEDWFELDLKRNLLCHCSKWSTVRNHLSGTVRVPQPMEED